MSSDESNQPKKSFELSHALIFLKAAKAGVEAAVTEHKKRQQSVVIWHEGKVVEVEPEDIPDFPKEDTGETQDKTV
jgi:hypothetical protein